MFRDQRPGNDGSLRRPVHLPVEPVGGRPCGASFAVFEKADSAPPRIRFAADSPVEGGVTCELVSGNPDFNVRKKENGRPKAKFDQYLDLV